MGQEKVKTTCHTHQQMEGQSWEPKKQTSATNKTEDNRSQVWGWLSSKMWATQHEELRPDSSIHVNQPDIVACICNPNAQVHTQADPTIFWMHL